MIRTSTVEEADLIRAAVPDLHSEGSEQIFMLQSQGQTDYVLGPSVGWHEDIFGPVRQSFFIGIDPNLPLWPWSPLDGINAMPNVASRQDLIAALAADPEGRPRRDEHRWVYIVMTRVDRGKDRIPDISGAGVFVTREDAEDAQTMIAPKVVDCWIEQLPIAL